jgi:microcystin-dependent protein
MSEPFIGEIRMFGGAFAPYNWALCNGQTLAIAQNEALFTLIGTTFGGDGVQTFRLPDLQGRLPIGSGQGRGLSNRVLGESDGVERVTLTAAAMPAHNHAVNASTVGATASALSGRLLPGVVSSPSHFYVVDDGTTPAPGVRSLPATTIATQGQGHSHDNLMPSLCVSFIISLYGIYPSRN